MKGFEQIQTKLDELALTAARFDRQRGEHHRQIFDERLFQCRARFLEPCVREALATYQAIVRQESHLPLNATKMEYLSDLLCSQIAAIQREIAKASFSKNEVAHPSSSQVQVHVLYQKRIQHQEWARRLKQMVLEKQQALEMASIDQKPQAHQDLLATEQRLVRCETALADIENDITFQEKTPK